jgi:FdhE protein
MSDAGAAKQGLMNIGEEAKPPFVILPDLAKVFLTRSQRFAELAPGHQLQPYLEFLSRLTAAQHDVLGRLPPVPALDQDRVSTALVHGMPPVAIEAKQPDTVLDATVVAFLDALSTAAMPEPPRTALAGIHAALPPARALMLADALADEPAADLAQRTLLLAALQVHATRLAAQLDADALKPIADGICPACGNPPAASAVVGMPGAHNSRFCFCSLCSTAWHVVRVKCTLCSSTGGIAYQTIEGQSDAVRAETCDSCKRYVKIMYQIEHPKVEAFADDVASLGLDLLLRDSEWQRGGHNLFLLGY